MPTDDAYREVLRRLDERDNKEGPMGENVGELDAQFAGQRLTLKNAPVNTIVTVATFLVVCLLAYAFWQHQMDAREASASFVSAVKEQTTVQREQTVVMREANCLQAYQGPAVEKGAFCRQIAR